MIAIPRKSSAQTPITHLCFTPPNRSGPTDVWSVAGSTSGSGARPQWPPLFRRQHDHGWMDRVASTVINLKRDMAPSSARLSNPAERPDAVVATEVCPVTGRR